MLALLWKERGPSSHRALGALARALAVPRSRGKSNVGHTGTLDPFAEGLLLVGTEEGTKLLSAFAGLEKTYVATFDWAHRSETFDTESPALPNFPSEGGLELAQAHRLRESLDETRLQDFLRSQRGPGRQVPPLTSAVHVDGKRAYEWAREGVAKELKARDIEIFQAEVLQGSWPECTIKLRVSAGTYIRSLARDWGLALTGHPARLSRLIRTGIGPFEKSVDDLSGTPAFLPLFLKDLEAFFHVEVLSPEEEKALRHGRWSGRATGPTLLIDPRGEVRAWTSESARLGRVFLKDPLEAPPFSKKNAGENPKNLE